MRADEYGHQNSVFGNAFHHFLHLFFGILLERVLLEGNEGIYGQLGEQRFFTAAVRRFKKIIERSE